VTGKVAMFVNGEFDRVVEFQTHAEATAFAQGVEVGGSYSSCAFFALVWPDAEAEIRELDAAQGKGVLAALGVQ
jgi:hypothetical protein